MTRSRGILNRRALQTLNNSLSTSGILRSRESAPNNFTYDVNQTVIHMQKSAADLAGQGRLQFAANTFYIPQYNIGIGASAGSGYTTTSPGIYLIDGMISCSGNRTAQPEEVYAGAVLVDSVAASGTETFERGNGAAALHVRGIIHADTGAVINIGAKTIYGTLNTIGAEDLANAPAATLTIVKLGADELSFNT